MPEGHKTHWIARQQTDLLGGQTLKVTSPQGRFRGDARKVSGRMLDRVTAAGKHLFYEFDGGRLIHVHLGRYGKYRIHDTPPPAPVGKVRVRMVGQSIAIDLNGPTTCRVIDQETRNAVVSKLGPDPLAGGRRDKVWELIKESGKPIAALLLDQSVIAGVGNIFRAELLYEIGLAPQTPGKQLSKSQFDELWKSLVRMMKVGLKHGRIITVTAKEAGKPLSKLGNRERFRVYGKDVCAKCDRPVETTEIAARKLYWCPRCQS